MTEQTNLVPKRRFKEYQKTDAWEQRKLSELCIKFTDGDWIEAKDQSNDGVRLIQTGNIGVTTYLDKTSNQKWISKDTFERLHCEEVFPGDILISRLPEPAGRACIVPDLGKKMITAVDCTIVRTKQGVSNRYLVQYLSTDDYFNEVNTLLAGGTRQRISRSSLSEFTVPIPKDDKEQNKIGQFFENIDNLITLHQRKLEKTKALKSAYLSEMFPAEGECEPRRRFAGFTDAWEQRRLGRISKLGSSKRVNREDYAENGIPFFRGLEISKLGISSELEEVLYISEEYYTNLKNKYGVPQTGDILITAVGTLGNTYLIRDTTPFYFKDGNLIWISDIQINPQYLNIYLGDGIGKKRVLESAVGSNQKALTMVKLQNVQVLYPSYEEQVQIGDFFAALDHLITLYQRKLEKLQSIKKAYLNEMFV